VVSGHQRFGVSKFKSFQESSFRSFTVSDLNGVVVNVVDCYPKGAGFDSGLMNGFFPHVRDVEDIGLTNQTRLNVGCCAIVLLLLASCVGFRLKGFEV
jgi:hypothetical protein